METKQHSLLSLKTCVDLNLTVNDSVHMVADKPLENILAEYDSVFKGIGCLPGEYDIETDESITPVQVRPRKIPLSMKEEVKTKLDTLTKQCIIEHVESPTPWISHLQPVRKSNGTVRICLDPLNLNQARKRNHYQIIIIINNNICLRHISSNKTILEAHYTLHEYTDYLKINNRDVVVK